LRSTYLICVFAFFLTPFIQGAAAPKKKVPSKAAATAKKSVAATKHPRTASRARSRPSSPPRQQTPSTERYIEIQQALAAKGFYKGEANGVWSSESVEALKQFQADQKLTPDGKIGSRSLIGLGLGPKHEANSEIVLPPPPPPTAEGKE
jgi:peptidoglycan hydrolase-like protein with peptidoglycan-binding domain